MLMISILCECVALAHMHFAYLIWIFGLYGGQLREVYLVVWTYSNPNADIP